MKTAVSVLQELTIKLGDCPEYECIAKSGPQHYATFEYRCTVRGVSVTGLGHSKKKAKQEAARRMLMQLQLRGLAVPPPSPRRSPPPSRNRSPPSSPGDDPALLHARRAYARASPSLTRACPQEEAEARGAPAPEARTFVTLLKELCDEYRLGEIGYELVSDTGPAHQRRFTVHAHLRLHERLASATTKKAARQLAAETLYSYLRENLVRLTGDFVETGLLENLRAVLIGSGGQHVAALYSWIWVSQEEALARAIERRAAEKRPAEGAGPGNACCAAEAARHGALPHLGLHLADYHLDAEVRARGTAALAAALVAAERGAGERSAALGAVRDALWLRAHAAALRLEPASPALAFAVSDQERAAALRYLWLALSAAS